MLQNFGEKVPYVQHEAKACYKFKSWFKKAPFKLFNIHHC